MTHSEKIMFALLRAGLRLETREGDKDMFGATPPWDDIYDLSKAQGVQAIVWDGVMKFVAEGVIAPGQMPPLKLKLSWAYNVEQIETWWAKQQDVIEKLAAFYAAYDIEMMVVKGYGVSLMYPEPNHRPCGDIDIWLFGKQQEADDLIREHYGISIDEDKHHHTVFTFDGVMIENHYDFVDVYARASNRVIEGYLKKYVEQERYAATVGKATIYLPSAYFNALFLLRHAGMHFASTEITMRHVIDWAMFVDRYYDKIDWTTLEYIAYDMNIHRFLHCLNAIAIDYIGIEATKIPAFERDAELENRVLNEVLHPEFSEAVPKGNIFKLIAYKTRRRWANRWKQDIVFKESFVPAFIQSTWAHLLKPKSIKYRI